MKIRKLSVMAYGVGVTWFAYATDFPNTITEPGFFDEASNMLRPGDIIIASGTGGAKMRVVLVADEDRGVVVAACH